jgi:hypothetical protein
MTPVIWAIFIVIGKFSVVPTLSALSGARVKINAGIQLLVWL